MAIQSLYPSINPSLNLDFANTKALDPRITFARASTATYYDGKTVAKAEENLFTYSQEFDNSAWPKSYATVTANTTSAPDGTTTADILTATAGSASIGHGCYVDTTLTGSTFSIFAKAGTNQYIQICTDSSNVRYANFDLTAGAGAVGTTGSQFINETITDVGNGWYRCSFQTNYAQSNERVRVLIVSSASAAWRDTFAGALGTESIYIWGAQLEQRSSVTAYTPTTTQPITNYVPVLQTAAANVARFDHDPVTGESLGLLIEEQRTNLLTFSEQFDNAVWVKSNSTVTANAVVAPDGTLTGETLVPSSTSGFPNIRSGSRVSGTTYTVSVYAKAAGYNYLKFNAVGMGGYVAVFNLSTGSVLFSGSYTSTSVQSVGDGWYRCSATYTASNTLNTEIAVLNPDGIDTAFTGNGYSGIYVWGAQFEAGAFPTSYIPTTTAQVTRSADAASMTGANFSSWYRADEGTLYAELSQPAANTSMFPVKLQDSSGVNYLIMYFLSNSSLGMYAGIPGASQVNVGAGGAGSIPPNTFGKAAIGYAVNNFGMSQNAGSVVIDTNAVVPSVDRLFLRNTGSGNIKKLAYYPKRLANAQLQAITS